MIEGFFVHNTWLTSRWSQPGIAFRFIVHGFFSGGSARWPHRTMSVYYYVTRNSGPFVKEGRREITEAEWRAAVAADPELAVEQPEQSGPRGASSGVWAVWHSYPGGYPAWFVLLKNGDVEVKEMDEALYGKFKRL